MDIQKRSDLKKVDVQVFNGKEYYLYPNSNYFSKGRKRLHRVIWEYYNGDISKDYEIHHVDGNTFNNEISNLNIIHKDIHRKLSSKIYWSNQKNRDIASERMKKRWSDVYETNLLNLNKAIL